MSLEQDIRAEIENIKKLKMEVGNINNHLSALEGMCRGDTQKQVDDAYKRGYEDGKKYFANGCVGCQYESDESRVNPCCECARVCNDHYIPKQSDRIEVGDEVIYNGTTKCLVITPETGTRYASILDCNGIHYSADHRELKKTGKHYDIQSILEAMKK